MNKLPALLALTIVLAACGASQSSTPVNSNTDLGAGSGAVQTLSGTVTALSSDHLTLTVAGQSLHLATGLGAQGLAAQSLTAQSSGAKVRVNGDDSNELALSVGQQVTVAASGDTATTIDIEQEVRGVIDSVDVAASTVSVAGQIIKVAAASRIELSRGESSDPEVTHTLAELKALKSPFAEITGSRDAAGLLVATSIEVRSAAERHEQNQADQAEVHGVITGLDTAAKTFSALGTSVDYSRATLTGTPANGLEAEARGNYDPASKVLLAARVRVENEGERGHEHGAPAAGSVVKLEEKVRSLDAAAKTLVAGHFKVEFSKATVTGTPAVRAEVRVQGTLDATDATLVHATIISFRADD